MKRTLESDREASIVVSDTRPQKSHKRDDEKRVGPWEAAYRLHQLLQRCPAGTSEAPELTRQLTKTFGTLVRFVDGGLFDGLELVDDCLRLLRHRKHIPLLSPIFEFLAALDLKNLDSPKASALIDLSMDYILEEELTTDSVLAIISTIQTLQPPKDSKLLQCVFRVMERSNCGYDWAESILLDAPDTPQFLQTHGSILIDSFFNDEDGNDCEWLLTLFDKYPFFWDQCIKSPRFHELLTNPHRFWSFDLDSDDYRALFLQLWKDLPLLKTVAAKTHSPFVWSTIQLSYRQPKVQIPKAQAIKRMMEGSFYQLTQNQPEKMGQTEYFNFFRACTSMKVHPLPEPLPFPHTHGVISDIAKIYPLINTFGDVELEVEGKRFKCHKVIMAQASKYFELLFTVDMREKGQKVIQINDVEPEVMEKLVYFIYHNQLEFQSMRQVFQMLYASSRFQIDPLKQVCFRSMLLHMTPDDFESAYEASQYPEFEQLKPLLGCWLVHNWGDIGDHSLKHNELEYWQDIAHNYLGDTVRHC